VTGNLGKREQAKDCHRHQPPSWGGEIVKKEIQTVNSELVRCCLFYLNVLIVEGPNYIENMEGPRTVAVTTAIVVFFGFLTSSGEY
jgi:hypothetical protein